MRIGIDLDGVLVDFIRGFNAVIKAETGIELTSSPTEWNYHRTAGVTREQENKVWEYIKTSFFWGTLHALPGALEALERLNTMRKQGDDIYFITSRPGKLSKFLSELWLRNHGMDTPTVLVTDDKGPVAKGLGLDVFIDDRPENNNEVIHEAGPGKVRVYLLGAPYNEWATDPKVYGVRIASINEMLDLELERKAA